MYGPCLHRIAALGLILVAGNALAANFGGSSLTLRVVDQNGRPMDRHVSAHIASDQSIRNGALPYELRMSLSRELGEQCREGRIGVRYRFSPIYKDRNTGQVINPNTSLVAALAIALVNPDGQQYAIFFDVPQDGQVRIKDRLVEPTCMSPNYNVVLECPVQWADEAEMYCR